MCKHYKKIGLLPILFLLVSFQALSQVKPIIKERVISKDGMPTLIKLDQSRPVPLYEAEQILKDQLALPKENKLKMVAAKTDDLGMVHQKFQQYYNGVKVEYATYNVHGKNNNLLIMNGDAKDIKDINTIPMLSSADALQMARQFIGAEKYMWEDPQQELWAKKIAGNNEASFLPEGELVIVDNYLTSDREKYRQPTLAYKLNVYAMEPLSRDYIYVDAQTGEIINRVPIIKHAAATGTADTRYSGSQQIETDSNAGSFRLREYTRGLGIETYNMNTGTNYNNAVDFVDDDNNWTTAEWDNAAKDNAALDAHWGAQMTYDYFLTVHNRDGYDDSGAKIRSYVHFGSNYENAFWNGSVMTYGDGNTRFDALTSLDVAAHEIGHAVMSNTADMVYEKEPGAMNEGFSDIWGASVEYFAAPDKSTWLIGEDIDLQQAALRSMSDPKSQGQPDTYQGTNWVSVTGCSPSSSNDYCGVHTNSGVLNYWFYLLSVGNSGTNDNGISYTITGITIDKAAKIAYRAESIYLGSNSVYNDGRDFTIQAAQDLYGVGSNEEIQTTNAWNAVGIGAKYGSIEYCASKANNTNDEYIGRVQLGTIDNTTGGSAGGYADYTSISTDLELSAANTITITPMWTGVVYNEAYSVWIDYNADGDFADSGEQVFSKSASKTNPVSGSFTVPESAKEGTTRMRVAMKYNGIPSACETFQWGEVEDYAINITGGGPDTTPPSAPTNLTAANITISSVDLSWTASTDNVGVTGYDVYQDGSLIASVTTTSHSVTGLASGTTYAFTVSAKDAAGNVSALSSAVNVTTETPDTTAPSVPTGLVASAVTQTSLTLSWDASTDNVGVTGYDVYQDGSLITSVTGTSTNVSGLAAGTAYAYTVSAKDAAGNVSAASTALNVTTDAPDTTPPTVPTGLVASAVTETSLTLSWDASTDDVGVTGYDVYQDGSLIASVTGTTFGVTGLTGGTTYAFTVSAKDAADNVSAVSSALNVTTVTPDTTPPSVPTGLVATAVTETSFTLSWDASTDDTGVTGYDVYQDGTLLTSVTGTSTNVSGLSASTTYSYTLSAKDAAGNVSANSSPLEVTTEAASVTYCTAGGNIVNYEYIDLVQLGTIDNATGANGGYGDFTSQSTTLVTGSSNTINFSAGFPGGTYNENWKIWIDFNHDGDFTDAGEEIVSGSTNTSGTASGTFSVPSGATIGSTRMRVAMAWNTTPSSCGTFTFGEVEDYTIIISATSLDSFAGSGSFNFGEDINPDLWSLSLKTYPNPVSYELNFNFNEFKEVSEVKIFDLNGIEMHRFNADHQPNTINVSEFANGMYIIFVDTERGQFETKFIKQ